MVRGVVWFFGQKTNIPNIQTKQAMSGRAVVTENRMQSQVRLSLDLDHSTPPPLPSLLVDIARTGIHRRTVADGAAVQRPPPYAPKRTSWGEPPAAPWCRCRIATRLALLTPDRGVILQGLSFLGELRRQCREHRGRSSAQVAG